MEQHIYLKYWLLSKIKNEICDLQLKHSKLCVKQDKENNNIKKLRINADIELVCADIFKWQSYELGVMKEIDLATI